jgi:Flp pilus assembly pilin Flp
MSWLEKMNRKGQSTLEYSVLIALIVGAIIVIQPYVGRALKGRYRDSTDNIGGQYDSGHMIADHTTTIEESRATEIFGDTGVGMGVSFSSSTGGKRSQVGSEETLRGLNEETVLEVE